MTDLLTAYINAPTAYELLADDIRGLAEPAPDGFWTEEYDFGQCGDCDAKLQSGMERSDGLCHSCVRERAGR